MIFGSRYNYLSIDFASAPNWVKFVAIGVAVPSLLAVLSGRLSSSNEVIAFWICFAAVGLLSVVALWQKWKHQ
jgi:hypothetical protein